MRKKFTQNIHFELLPSLRKINLKYNTNIVEYHMENICNIMLIFAVYKNFLEPLMLFQILHQNLHFIKNIFCQNF